MRVLRRGLLPILLILASAGARAHEMDIPVTFSGVGVAGAYQIGLSPTTGGVLLRLGPSDRVDAPFDTILLHGIMPDANVAFEVSRLGPTGVWGAWRRAAVRRRPNGRFWAKVVFPDALPGYVRFRARNEGVSIAHTLTLYELSASVQLRPEGSLRGSPSGYRAAASSRPAVIPREGWGARPPREPYSPHSPVSITQHHTAGVQTMTLKESMEEVRFIQEFHQEGRGWDDIGYHFLIDGQGHVFQGRPESVVGAHVRDANEGNIGITLMGYHHPPFDHPLTPAQREALRRLGRWLLDAYGILPETYMGHRDLGPTACPGDGLYAALGEIRDSFKAPPETPPVADRLGRGKSALRPLAEAREGGASFFDGGKD